MRLEPKMGQACSHTWFISWARREPRERERERRGEEKREMHFYTVSERAGRQGDEFATRRHLTLRFEGEKKWFCVFLFFYGEYMRTWAEVACILSSVSQNTSEKKQNKTRSLRTLKEQSRTFLIFSVVHEVLSFYIWAFYIKCIYGSCVYLYHIKKTYC